jgi:DNA-binding FadR family transcriptional regulator
VSGPAEVRQLRTSQTLADHLRRSILEGEVADGDPLPSERALAEQSGTGRSSVREALRILEAEGLVATRRGRGGGAVVRRPAFTQMAHSIDVFVRGRNVRYATVLEARQVIEPGAAMLAASHRSPADLAELLDLHRLVTEAHRADDVAAFVEANLAWHLAVIRASANDLLIGIMLGLTALVRASLDEAEFYLPGLRAESLRAHDRITDAVVRGDGAAAGRRMARHLHAHEEVYLPRLGDRPIAVDPGTGAEDEATDGPVDGAVAR